MFSGDWYILGAKSIAIGVIRALRMCHHDCNIKGVIVSSKETNPEYVEGYKVEELSVLSRRLDDKEKSEANILIATSIYLSGEIKGTLKNFGFKNITELDSKTETELMGGYYKSMGVFESVKSLKQADITDVLPKTTVLEVRHHSDQPLKHKWISPEWVHVFQAGIPEGRELSSVNGSVATYRDTEGDNIADKNFDYCELTAYYWAWKNLDKENLDKENLDKKNAGASEYIGVSRNRRYLDVDREDLIACSKNNVQVVLSYPMVHLPNVCDYHKRYTSEEEWEALVQAVKELAPEYSFDADRIWGSQYMYKFNMLIAKKDVFTDYCSWLFPILFRTEEILREKNITTSKRYMAYFGECLMTLYFMHNAYKLNIRHTGRMMRI